MSRRQSKSGSKSFGVDTSTGLPIPLEAEDHIDGDTAKEILAKLDVPLEDFGLNTRMPWTGFRGLYNNQKPQHRSRSPKKDFTFSTSQNLDGETSTTKSPAQSRIQTFPARTPSPSRSEKPQRSTRQSATPHVGSASKSLRRPSTGSAAGGRSKALSPVAFHDDRREENSARSSAPPTATPRKDTSMKHRQKVPANVLDAGLAHSLIANSAVELVSDNLVLPTVDATMTDLRTVTNRVKTMVSSLQQARPPPNHGLLSVTKDTDVTLDPELREIAELKRINGILQDDIATQSHAIRHLEKENAAKTATIDHLSGRIEELENALARAEEVSSYTGVRGFGRQGSQFGGDGSPLLGGTLGRRQGGGVTFGDSFEHRNSATRRMSNRKMSTVRFSQRHSIFGQSVSLSLKSGRSGSTEMAEQPSSSATTPTAAATRGGSINSNATFRSRLTSMGARSAGGDSSSSAGPGDLDEDSDLDEYLLTSAKDIVQSADDPAIVSSTLAVAQVPVYNDIAPTGCVTFAAFEVDGLAEMIRKDSNIVNKALHAFGLAVEAVTREHGGHVVNSQERRYILAFKSYEAAAGTALKVQHMCGAKAGISYPFGFADIDPDNTGDVYDDDTGLLTWHGLRICMALCEVKKAAVVRDCVSRDMLYYGRGVKLVLYLLGMALPGCIVIQPDGVGHIDRAAIALEDPVVVPHRWAMVPGERRPQKLYRMICREHHPRLREYTMRMRQRMSQKEYRILGRTDVDPYDSTVEGNQLEDSSPDQTRVVTSSAAFQGSNNTSYKEERRMRDSDDSSFDDEEEESIESSSTSISISGDPEIAAMLEPLAEFTETKLTTVGNGDMCVVLLFVPAFDAMVQQTDEQTVVSYLKRFHQLVKDLTPVGTVGNVFTVRSSKSAVMLGFTDTDEAVKFSLSFLETSISMVWPGNSELLRFIAQRKWRGKVVANGLPIGIAMHYCKINAVKELFHGKQAVYVGEEMHQLELMRQMAVDAAEEAWVEEGAPIVGSIMATEIVVAAITYRNERMKNKRTGGYVTPLIVPQGLLPLTDTAGGSALRPVFSLLPKELVGRHFLQFHVAMKSGGLTQSALRRHLSAEWNRHHFGRFIPDAAALAESSTIASNTTQAIVLRAHFDAVKRNAVLETTHRVIHDHATRGSKRARDIAALEQIEEGLMFAHDTCMPSTAPQPIVTMDLPVLRQVINAHVTSATVAGKFAHAADRMKLKGLKLKSGGGNDASGGGDASPVSPAKEAPVEERVGLDVVNDAEQAFFVERANRITAEVAATHKMVQFFFDALRAYVAPLVDDSVPSMEDDDFIVNIVQLRRQLVREASEEKTRKGEKASEVEKSPFSSTGEVKVGELWRSMMGEAIRIEAHDSSQYDAVNLCRSLVAQCCRHFLFMRTVSKRIIRVVDLARAETENKQVEASGGARMAQTVNELIRRKREEKMKVAKSSKQGRIDRGEGDGKRVTRRRSSVRIETNDNGSDGIGSPTAQ